MGEKLGTDPRIGQPLCCGSGGEPFSEGGGGGGAVDPFDSVDDYMKDCYV
jgi:hypothetical protein